MLKDDDYDGNNLTHQVNYSGQPIGMEDNDQGESDGQKTYNLCFIVKLTAIAAVGGFLFGYDTGVISGAQLYFDDTWPDITDTERSLTVSLATLGAAVGSLVSGLTSDKYGRKKPIMFADILFTLGAILMAVAPTIPTLMVGRFLVGLGDGIAAQIVPLYLSEVAPVEIRGQLVAFNVA